jgi:hypothetical protein
LDELHLIIGVAVRTGATAMLSIEEKNGDVHFPIALTNEMMRAAPEWQVFLADA